MPAADVIDPSIVVPERESDLIRAGLRKMTEDDRRSMWGVLDLVEATLHRGVGWDRVQAAVELAPAGLVRDVCHQIAWLRFERSSARPATNARIPRPAYKTKPLTTVTGRAADPDVWSAHWTWSSLSPDAITGHVRRARYDAEFAVLPVLYRHSGDAIGLTRRWYTSEDDGGLDVEFQLLPTARSQYAGRCIQDGILRGLSLSTRPTRTSWCHYSPNEWEPALGKLDMERHHAATVVELSLTPQPAQGQHSQVRHIW